MAANKLIQQPDILNLDSLGAFMDAQNDPIPTEEEKEVTTIEDTASDADVQDESSEVIQVDTTPQRPKVTRARRGRQTNVQPVIEAGSGEWDTMLRYAEFYNDNPDENRITVVLNPDIKRALDIIRINDRYFINVACFGIDADIANEDNFIHNRFIPRSMRYNAGVVYYFLTYKARAMKIKVNDQLIEKDFTTVVAGNAQYYGNGYHVTPNGDVKDGVMEVLLADKVNKAAMAKLILSMKDSSHLKNPAVQIFSCRKLEVSADQPFQANIDGEPLKASHFELEVLPKGFRIYLDYDFINRIIQ